MMVWVEQVKSITCTLTRLSAVTTCVLAMFQHVAAFVWLVKLV